ncbi:MAG: hypothetical protein J6K21_04240 [Bacilli bacterium]|nr:hypothetical protein [Bacilli bacterium]
MFINITIGKYIYKDSLIHKIHPLIKLLLLIVILLICLTSNLLENLLILLLILVLCLLTKINIKIYLKNIYSLRYILIPIILIDLIFKVDVYIILNNILKVIISLMYTSLYLYTTTINEINYSLNRLLKPFKKLKIDVDKISLILTLSIKFINIVIDVINEVLKAYKIRGLDFKGNIKLKVKKIKTFLITLFYIVMKKADNISDIIEIRNYNLNNLNRKNKKIELSDYLFIHIIVVIIIIIKGVLKCVI